jgi:peptide deformylase
MEVIKNGDKILKKKAKRVNKIDDTIRNIAANMIECMEKNNGIGISGNQVGVLKRIIIVLINNQPKVMINPEIILKSKETCVMNEGCLSFPEQFYDIERPEKVTVKYRSIFGYPTVETYDGLTARCIYHEIDHLDGIVFTERT